MNLPKHIELSIRHNPHRGDYMTIDAWLQKATAHEGIEVHPDDWGPILDANEVWVVDWHPDTPVGSIAIAAATLQRALDVACARSEGVDVVAVDQRISVDNLEIPTSSDLAVVLVSGVRRTPLLHSAVPLGVGPFRVQGLRYQLFVGESRQSATASTAEARAWTTAAEIADFVQGDGTDPQRIAIADAIREGRKQL